MWWKGIFSRDVPVIPLFAIKKFIVFTFLKLKNYVRKYVISFWKNIRNAKFVSLVFLNTIYCIFRIGDWALSYIFFFFNFLYQYNPE